MIVMGSQGISHLAAHVRQTLHLATSDHAATNLRFTAMCLDLIAEDYDRAVNTLCIDRAELEGIFQQASAHLTGDLRALVDARLASKAIDLRVGTLTRSADDDMLVLIEIHEWTECGGVDRIREADLNDKIWSFLENYAERRTYRSPI